jgi:hypothetical protein
MLSAWLIAMALNAVVLNAEPVRLDRPQPTFLYGDKFRDVLRQPLIASWDNVEPRSLFRRLSEDRQIAFVIDRRVDPSTPLTLSLTGESLQSGCERIAEVMGAAVSLPGHVVYVGPEDTTRWLRTAIEQHELALRDPDRSIPMRRLLDLSARHTIHWQDLDTPREILTQIAKRHRLTIENLDAVPHDLWASATLPQATAAEALTIVLTQFDLGWDWRAGGNAIRIGPWQEPPRIERRYKPRGRLTAAQLLADWQGSNPELTARVERAEVVVLARVEEHEALQSKLSAGITGQTLPAGEAPTPLRRRLFTLRIENAPVSAIMRELEKSGVVFDYDAAAFRAAGVNLDRPVNIDVLKANADEFLQKLFGDLGVTYEIDTLTVRLKVKS